MKKLVLFFAMATVVAFSACTSKTATQETTEPATEVPATEAEAPAPVEEAPADTTATAPAETPAE
jgi:PBP1b-binding outer membrane lipoprotein LpoB